MAIRMMKERIRAIVNQLPFKSYPHRLIVEMVYNVVFWLNIFPHKDGVHEVMSPHTILTGLHINTTNTVHSNSAGMCKYTRNMTTL